MVCSWALARTVDRALAQLQALIITIQPDMILHSIFMSRSVSCRILAENAPYWSDTTKMVRYDGLLNPFHSINLSRLTHPTILLFVCSRALALSIFGLKPYYEL